MKSTITGIQQIGVGNPHVQAAWQWAQKMGSDLKLFDSADEAPLMTPYTGGEVHRRHAIFALNLQGGGGLELWQFTSRKCARPDFEPRMGDLGIYAAKIKVKDVPKAYEQLRNKGIKLLGDIAKDPTGSEYFSVVDPFGNVYQLVSGGEWFLNHGHAVGGVCGAVIGVSDMDRSVAFYRNLLGFDTVVYDRKGSFGDWSEIYPNAGGEYRRVLLKKSRKPAGYFSSLVDSGQIELVQSLDREPKAIFGGRYWGDAGFIHLCFDVQGMDEIKKEFESKGAAFTVDSQSAFDMNEASGRFAYVEDPDGTLIELVEAFKIPILKKLGWYLNLEKRDPKKPLPKMLFRAMGISRNRM